MSDVVDYDEESIDPISIISGKVNELGDDTEEAAIENESSVLGATLRQSFLDGSNAYLGRHMQYAYQAMAMDIKPTTPVNREAELSMIPEEDHKHYAWCESKEDFDAETEQLIQERQDREILEKHPIQAIVAGLAVGAVEMALVAPLTGGIGTSAVTGGAVKKLAVGAFKGGKSGVVTGGISSTFNLANQDLYTAEEAMYTTLASGILCSTLGTAGAGLSLAVQSKYVKNLKDKLATGFEDSWFRFKKTGKPPQPEDFMEIVVAADGTKSEFTYNDMHPFVQKMIRNNPITQGLGSDSEVLQIFTDTTYRHNFLIKARAKGEYVGSTSVEAGKEVRNAIFEDMSDLFFKEADEFIARNPECSTRDFSLFVTRNIKEQTSKDPNVIKASERYKDWLNKEIDDAVKYKYFDNDPRVRNESHTLIDDLKEGIIDSTVAKEYNRTLDYFTTVYDRDMIAKNETKFMWLVKRKIGRENPEYTDEKITKVYHTIYDNIVGDNLERYALPFKSKEGNVKITKERKFLIDSGDFEDFEEFLVNDPIEVGNLLRRQFSPGIEFSRVNEELFAHRADLKEKTVIGKWLTILEEERNQKINVATSDIAKQEIRDKYRKYAELISDGELLIRGTYDAPTGSFSLKAAQAANAVQTWNYMRHLGGVGLSSLVDIKNIVSRVGLSKTVSSLLRSFSKDSAFQLNKADLKKWGAANELALLTSGNRYLDHADLSAYRGGRINRGLRKVANSFSKLTLMQRINDHNKRIMATLHGTDIIEACLQDTLSLEQSQFLAQARIPFGMRDEIKKRFLSTGYFDEDGLAVLKLENWIDDEVTRTFASSITASANQTIIIPSSGDTPRIFKKKWGKILFQYKSYQFGLVNNVIAPMFNGQNSHASATIAASVGLGYFVYWIKSLASGDPYKHLDDPEFHAGAIEQSDLFGYFSDASSFIRRSLNANNTFSDAVERFSPTAGMASDLYHLKNQGLKWIDKGEEYKASEKTLKRIKNLLPFNNLFYYNWFINNSIRYNAERNDRKLSKTREDRYWENKQ